MGWCVVWNVGLILCGGVVFGESILGKMNVGVG